MNRGDDVMTEPDEALLWARENSPPHIYVEQANAANAYRAGAAASVERIKELEARVRKLEWVLRGMIAADSNNLPDRSKQHNLEVALEVLKEPDQ